VRGATQSDVDAIVDVHVETWKVAYRGQLPDEFLAGLDATRPRRAEVWRRAIASESQRVLVAEREGRVVGFVSVGPADDKALPADVGELYAIYVHPDAWDLGAGRDLIANAVEALRGLGHRAAVLWVLGSNERARRFYERAGWSADGATKVDERSGVALHEVRYTRRVE
jgi:ribosomal protein S18 acetylase RimI-like enzyme